MSLRSFLSRFMAPKRPAPDAAARCPYKAPERPLTAWDRVNAAAAGLDEDSEVRVYKTQREETR